MGARKLRQQPNGSVPDPHREQRVAEIVAQDKAYVAEIAAIAERRDREMAAIADKRAEGVAELVELFGGNKAEAGRRLGWLSPTAHVSRFLERLSPRPVPKE